MRWCSVSSWCNRRLISASMSRILAALWIVRTKVTAAKSANGTIKGDDMICLSTPTHQELKIDRVQLPAGQRARL
jgi:hypothetical protein